MRRRDFVTFLSGAIAWVAAARAQELRRLIGVLGSGSYGSLPATETAFIQGVAVAGLIEGKKHKHPMAFGPKVNTTAYHQLAAKCRASTSR